MTNLPNAILGETLWRNRYGADPSVIGQTIRINGVPCTVVGIMPREFRFPTDMALWQPIGQTPGLDPMARDARLFRAFGKLRGGVDIVEARAELNSLADHVARDDPNAELEIPRNVVPFVESYIGPPFQVLFAAGMGAVAFVLLIACANGANLILSRSAYRAREIAIRMSLGASRLRVIRQLIVENLLLAFVSGGIGLGLSLIGVRMFFSYVEGIPGKPYWIESPWDGTIFAFVAGLCLGTGLLFGMVPALDASRRNVGDALKDEGRGFIGSLRRRSWPSALMVCELALTIVLLAGAGFMMRSIMAVYQFNSAIDTRGLITARLVLTGAKYDTPEQKSIFHRLLEERLVAIPTVASMTTASAFPGTGAAGRSKLSIDGRVPVPGRAAPMTSVVFVGSNYFETLQLTLIAGRNFTDSDGSAGYETAIVNKRFAAMHLPNEDPIGRRIRIDRGPVRPWLTIVGVSPDVRQEDIGGQDAVVYLPYRFEPGPFLGLIIRTEAELASVVPMIREQVRTMDPDLPVFRLITMEEVFKDAQFPGRVFTTLFIVFASIALVLSAMGLYAITAYTVARRTSEIGIRMALGARVPQVVWLVLRRPAMQVAVGLAIGLVGAVGVGQILGSVTVQTGGSTPPLLAVVVVVLIVVAAIACLRPVRWALRIDPVIALRYE